MALISTARLLQVADRAAYQYEQLQSVCATISAEGSGYYFDIVSESEDPDVEIPLDTPYYAVDQDFLVPFLVKNGTMLPMIVGGMEGHFSRMNLAVSPPVPLQVGGWDGYLQAKNERVSYYFALLFLATNGYSMLANDVFSESADQFAELQVTASPTLGFTDGMNYGNGSILNPAGGTSPSFPGAVFYAATQLKIVVVSMGATNLDVRLTVKDVNNNLTTIDVTIPGGSVPGAVVPIGTDTDRFLDVTAAIFKPAGSTGTVGDDMKVMNLKERQIAL